MLTSYNGAEITYDQIGNPLSYYNGSSYTFTWNGRKLATAVKGTDSMSFAYNDAGLRISKTVNGVTTHYVYDGNVLLAEYTDNETIVYIYDANDSPIGFKYRVSSYEADVWDVYWYGKNLQGDILHVYNASGTKLISYTYNAWGKITTSYSNGGASTTAIKNPYKYRGYYYDSDLSLYYLQTRYYDPVVCRFINADGALYGTMLGFNLFIYCENNPATRVDPSGDYSVDIKDDDGNPLNDWLLNGGEGGGTVYYTGPGSAYYNYAVYTSTCTYNAMIGGYHYNGSRGIGGNTADFATGGYVSVTDSMATSTHKHYTISGKPVISNSYPSTGRTIPKSLKEKLAMEEAKSNPFDGYQINKIKMADEWFSASNGWVKMQKIFHTFQGDINIHYNYNFKLNIYADFKFKDD